MTFFSILEATKPNIFDEMSGQSVAAVMATVPCKIELREM